MTASHTSQALLVLPRLRIQNANAISSPLTHGFPSITAFTGLMWALQRNLAAQGFPLQLRQVGVICHHHEEQVVDGYVKTFRLTRNPVDKDGSTAAIVEEGRIHLDITLVFLVDECRSGAPQAPVLVQGNEDAMKAWARQAGEIVAGMRVAGGSVLPARPLPRQRTHPWMEILPEAGEAQDEAFARWRRQWLPGYALVGRDELLAARLSHLREKQPGATALDAWLHAARFNYAPQKTANAEGAEGAPAASAAKLRWADPWRGKGSGWTVPIPVGYAALQESPLPAGTVANARDAATPLAFVESVYSFGEWISPHRLRRVHDLLWRAETDASRRLYRCRSGYAPAGTSGPIAEIPDFD